jgi:hypothetical protein
MENILKKGLQNSLDLEINQRITKGLFVSLIIFLIFFTFNPYLAIFLSSIIILTGNEFKKLNIIFPIIAFASFYSTREIGLDGGDDVVNYIYLYDSFADLRFIDIVTDFIYYPTSHEIFYFAFGWIIKNALNFSDNAFVFLNYLIIIYLISIVGNLLDKRYVFIFIFIYFFSLGDTTSHIMHVWRAQMALSVFLIGILIYFNKQKQIGITIAACSVGFHISLLIFFLIFISYIYVKRNFSLYFLILFFSLLGVVVGQLYIYFFNLLLAEKLELILNNTLEGVDRSPYYFLIISIFAIYYNSKYSLSEASVFLSYCCLSFAIFFIVCSSQGLIIYRYTSIGLPFIIVVISEMVYRQKKTIVFGVLILLFIYKISFLMNIVRMYDKNFSKPFYGLAAILSEKI